MHGIRRRVFTFRGASGPCTASAFVLLHSEGHLAHARHLPSCFYITSRRGDQSRPGQPPFCGVFQRRVRAVYVGTSVLPGFQSRVFIGTSVRPTFGVGVEFKEGHFCVLKFKFKIKFSPSSCIQILALLHSNYGLPCSALSVM